MAWLHDLSSSFVPRPPSPLREVKHLRGETVSFSSLSCQSFTFLHSCGTSGGVSRSVVVSRNDLFAGNRRIADSKFKIQESKSRSPRGIQDSKFKIQESKSRAPQANRKSAIENLREIRGSWDAEPYFFPESSRLILESSVSSFI